MASAMFQAISDQKFPGKTFLGNISDIFPEKLKYLEKHRDKRRNTENQRKYTIAMVRVIYISIESVN